MLTECKANVTTMTHELGLVVSLKAIAHKVPAIHFVIISIFHGHAGKCMHFCARLTPTQNVTPEITLEALQVLDNLSSQHTASLPAEPTTAYIPHVTPRASEYVHIVPACACRNMRAFRPTIGSVSAPIQPTLNRNARTVTLHIKGVCDQVRPL